MAEEDETEEPRDEVQASPTPKTKRQRLSFEKIRRDLSDDELASPGVQKMLLDELERMDGVESDFREFSSKYHDARTDLAVAQEKLNIRYAFDVLSTGAIAVGSLIFGAAFSIAYDEKMFWIVSLAGILVVIIGIAAKVIKS